MGKRFDIEKVDWKKDEDRCFRVGPEGEGRIDDIVIPVMGSAGVGKSTFINNVLEALGSKGNAPVDDGLNPCTSDVTHYVVELLSHSQLLDVEGNRRLVLVDTPGFDHQSFDTKEILRRIAVWLASSYGDGIKIAGVVYMHAIAPERMTESHTSGFELFRKICGKDPLPNIVLATTRWDICSDGPSKAKQLRDEIWKDMLNGDPSATMLPLDNTQESALEVVKKIVAKMPTVLRIQKQIVDNKKSCAKTDAGRIIANSQGGISNPLAMFKQFIQSL